MMIKALLLTDLLATDFALILRKTLSVIQTSPGFDNSFQIYCTLKL